MLSPPQAVRPTASRGQRAGQRPGQRFFHSKFLLGFVLKRSVPTGYTFNTLRLLDMMMRVSETMIAL